MYWQGKNLASNGIHLIRVAVPIDTYLFFIEIHAGKRNVEGQKDAETEQELNHEH